MRLIYCGCAGFGQIVRSFSLNSHHYSPQTIEKSASNQHNLVTITHLGQPPDGFAWISQRNITLGGLAMRSNLMATPYSHLEEVGGYGNETA